MGEIVLKKTLLEITYSFDSPKKAIYITHPEWNLTQQNIITEDQRLVMGFSYFDNF